MADIIALEKLCTQIRRDILRMVHKVNSGHPGGSLGCTEFFVSLYWEIMDHNPDFKMEGKNEDIFFLSNGHISPVYYAALARSGYFSVDELNTFRLINSRLQGHPATHEKLPGIRIASGSLGQGLSVACGAALGKKLDGDKNIVFALQGDGELQEGQNWEAYLFAAHQKIDNLIVTIDRNDAQIDGKTSDICDIGDIAEKLKVFNWQVLELENGNNINEVINTLNEAKTFIGKGKPIAIVMHTKMGYGVDFMHDKYQWHGKAPNDEQMEIALAQLEETIGDY